MSGSTEEWLAFAATDLRSAEVLFDEEIYSQVCFHSQQCVEKCLKAVLVHGGQSAPRTHSIADLLVKIPFPLAAKLPAKLIQFDVLYTPTRYPDTLPGAMPDSLPGRAKAEETLEWAREVFAITQNFVSL